MFTVSDGLKSMGLMSFLTENLCPKTREAEKMYGSENFSAVLKAVVG